MSENKSSVIKYSALKSPVSYNELAINTNINCPPSGWLQGKYAEKAPFAPSQPPKSKQASSLTIANSYVDHVGKVDVITDSENIKKLLKMTYSDAPVSLILHKVGKTILVDSFDAYRNFLLTKEHQWKWLRDFMTSTLNRASEMSLIPTTALSRQDVEANLMLSKFLYHSLNDKAGQEADSYEPHSGDSKLDANITDPLASKADSFGVENAFERDVLWNFEDIRMLIGTDLPIFGAGTHPCVTLRLRDMKKPISVLTGIDYWLDQLMCTVPEVVMCYHLNGIVQRYEILKTEDLPNMPGSSFSPELIRDVAQNILSFLKSNATKEGHTYWLFKDKDDEIVKLYDLTCVCQEYMDETSANPFTLPVAVLMYRAARNLLHKMTKSKKFLSKTVYRLLTHCLELIDANKFPQVAGSAHYFLANLYLNCGSVDALVNDDNASAENASELDDEWEYEDTYAASPANRLLSDKITNSPTCVSLNFLTKSNGLADKSVEAPPANPKATSIPCASNMEDCWQSALEHILKGLECIRVFDETNSRPRSEDADLKMADDSPIPLRYESLTGAALPLAVRLPNATGWRLNLTCLLLVKCIRVYEMLSDFSFKLQHYGKALRYVKLSFLCYESASKLINSVESSEAGGPLEKCKQETGQVLKNLFILCGDTHCMMSHINPAVMDKHIRDFKTNHYRDDKIASSVKALFGNDTMEYAWCSEWPSGPEQSFQLSQKAYEHALKSVKAVKPGKQDKNATAQLSKTQPGCNTDNKGVNENVDEVLIYKRLGNVKNSLGTYYMNLSLAILARKDNEETKQNAAENCWSISYSYYQDGIQIFNRINDKPNEALLNSNAGRLMRLCANAKYTQEMQMSSGEEYYLKKAIEMYQRALECVNPSESAHKVWESVAWELASVYYSFAVLLQERPTLLRKTLDEIEKEIVDLMQKSLRLVMLLDSIDDSKHTVYLFRISSIHHKLASLYHKCSASKDVSTERKIKHTKALTEMHYKKAAEGFKESVIESPVEFIRVQMERVVFTESSIENASSAAFKLNMYCHALELVVSCRSAFLAMSRKVAKQMNQNPKSRSKDEIDVANIQNDVNNEAVAAEPDLDSSMTEFKTMCDLTLHRIRSISKSALMVLRALPQMDKNVNKWKNRYAISLLREPADFYAMPNHVFNVLEKLVAIN